MAESGGNGHPDPKPDGLVESLRGKRGFDEIVRLHEAEAAISEHIGALAEAAVQARDPSAPPIVDLRALIPAWDNIAKLADSSIKSLKSLGVKEPPPNFEDVIQAKVAPLSDLSHLLEEEVEYTIKPICPRGALTMVQGMPKGGKSTFSLWLASCAAIGNWPSGILEIARPMNVLFIEFEDRPILVVKRASKYLAGAGFDPKILPSNLFLCDSPTLWLDSTKYEAALIQEVRDKQIDLVILDTLSYVHQAESENDAADMKILTAALKRIVAATNCSLIFLHHTGKGSKEKAISEAARGSSVIPACADVILHWGDRGDTDTTPLSVTSKYDDAFKCSVEYVRTKDGVQWRLEPEEKPTGAPRGQRGIEAVFLVVQQLLIQEPEGVRQASIVAMMADQSMPKPSVLRHLGDLIEQRKLTKRMSGRAVIYSLFGTPREA